MRNWYERTVAPDRRMYRKKESLDQRPKVRMMYSGTPAAARADAPPIRNEWVLRSTCCGKTAERRSAT